MQELSVVDHGPIIFDGDKGAETAKMGICIK